MGKVILVHANCHNPKAKGDFTFAGNIAKDIMRELTSQSIYDIDVILVSTLDGVSKFESLYGRDGPDRVDVEGTSIGLSSLEEFDSVENTVIAFIDANRCKHSPGDIVKRVLSPDSKFLFVGNVNQQAYSDLFIQTLYRMQVKKDQPGVYDYFDDNDMLIGSSGFGIDRLGLPTITKSEDLPELSQTQKQMVPSGQYGFMYVNAIDSSKDYKLIAQYIKLTGHDQYILVGDFSGKKTEIQQAYGLDTTLMTSKSFPQIQYHQSLPNGVMRRSIANTEGPLVLTTGVTSTLEAMRDNKLPYYQDMSSNAEFVAAYLIAVKSIVSSDNSLFGAMPQLIMELSNLLFTSKPLNKTDMQRTHDLLEMSSVSSRLVSTNQTIIDQSSGKISTKLLGFISGSRSTNDQIQLATVCASLRKKGELGSPVHDQALRRAAAWGRLFELKVLIKSMPTVDLNKKDSNLERTALHWAVVSKHLDCARALVKAGAILDEQDKEGRTPLHMAVSLGDRAMIKMLIEAGASIDIHDKSSQTPKDCSQDQGLILYVQQCHDEVISRNSFY